MFEPERWDGARPRPPARGRCVAVLEPPDNFLAFPNGPHLPARISCAAWRPTTTRPWMAEHRPDYQRARAACRAHRPGAGRNGKTDASLAGLTPTEAMFRLHKNDRATATPSLTSGAWARSCCTADATRPRRLLPGRAAGGPVVAAGGLLPHHAGLLGALRQEIHYDADEFHRHGRGGAAAPLPRRPRHRRRAAGAPAQGYRADDPGLAWLKLKSFGAVPATFTDAEVARGPGFVAQAVAAIARRARLVDFFNEALEPNG
ncbi:MAG: DUF2461 family protein [Hymenobacter sp.]